MPNNGQYLTTILNCPDSEFQLWNFKSLGFLCFIITEGFIAQCAALGESSKTRQTDYSGVEDEGILLTRAQPINCELGRPPEWAISIDITKAFELWPSKFRPLLSATISYDSLSSPSTWPHFGCKVDHKVIIIGIHKIFGWSTGLQQHHHPPSTWHYGPGHSMMMI